MQTHDLMSKQVIINPLVARTTFLKTKHTAIKGTRCVKIVSEKNKFEASKSRQEIKHWKGVMKRSNWLAKRNGLLESCPKQATTEPKHILILIIFLRME